MNKTLSSRVGMCVGAMPSRVRVGEVVVGPYPTAWGNGSCGAIPSCFGDKYGYMQAYPVCICASIHSSVGG